MSLNSRIDKKPAFCYNYPTNKNYPAKSLKSGAPKQSKAKKKIRARFLDSLFGVKLWLKIYDLRKQKLRNGQTA